MSRQALIANDFDIVARSIKRARMQLERMGHDDQIDGMTKMGMELADSLLEDALDEIMRTQREARAQAAA